MTFAFIIHVCTKTRDLTWIFHLFLFEGTDYQASCVYWLILSAPHIILGLCLGNSPFYCSWSLASQCDLCELPLLTWKLFSTIFLAAFVCDLPHWMPIFWPQKMLLKLYRYTAFLLLLGHPYKSVPLTVILLYFCFLASSYIFSHFPFLSKAAT